MLCFCKSNYDMTMSANVLLRRMKLSKLFCVFFEKRHVVTQEITRKFLILIYGRYKVSCEEKCC